MKVENKSISDIAPYAKNPRRNERAVDAVAASIKQFGWKQPIVTDAKGVIVVGHTRYYAALKLGLDKVPVVVAKDLSEDQCKAYRIADNKTNEIAEWNVGLLSEELKSLSEAGWTDFTGLAFNTKEIDALLSPLAEQAYEATRPTLQAAAAEQAPDVAQAMEGEQREYIEEPIEDDEEPEQEIDVQKDSILTYREDAVFSASNWLGFPDLRPDMLWDGDIRKVYIKDGDEAPTQMICWSSTGIDERMRGHVINFYASDDRFEHAIWDKAVSFLDKMRVIQPSGFVMPDFSTWADEPAAFNIWNTYRARWCARYWQEAGYRIIPNVNVADEASWKWIFLGLPAEVPCAMMQVRNGYNKDERAKRLLVAGVNEWCSRIKTRRLFMYGGEHQDWLEPLLPKGPEYIWFPSYHKARKDAGLF